MMNRLLRNRLRLWLLAIIFNPILLAAQYSQITQFFNFQYNGPSDIPVDGDCHGKLRYMGGVVVTSTVGATITTSFLDTATISQVYGSTVGIDTIFAPNESLTCFWRVGDNQGHTFNFQFPLQFHDLTGPTLFFNPQPPTSATYASIKLVPPPPVVYAIDNCIGSTTVNFVETPRPPLCQAGTFKRTWFSSDNIPNTRVFNEIITILADVTGPTITTFPQNSSGNCITGAADYQAWLNAQLLALQGTDLNGVASKNYNAPPLNLTCGAATTATFNLVDSCGNVSQATATFSLTDAVAPIFTQIPNSLIVPCDMTTPAALGMWISDRAGLTASDNCTPNQNLIFSMKLNGSTIDSTGVQTAFEASKGQPCGTKTIDGTPYQKIRAAVEIEFVVSDGCNSISKKATFASQDLTAPIFLSPPIDSFSPCDGAVVLADFINNHASAVAEDACSTVSWSSSVMQNPFSCGNSKSWEVTFTIADACANDLTGSATFYLVDYVGPTISVAQTQVTEPCGGGDDAQKLHDFIENKGGATLTDNCSPNPTWTNSFTWTTSGGVTGTGKYGIGPYPIIVSSDCDWFVDVRFTGKDECGNTNFEILTFQIEDLQPPIFAQTSSTDTVFCQNAIPPAVQPTATDNCSTNLTFTNTITKSDSLCTGKYKLTRLWTATDDCLNTATFAQITVVLDTIGPVFTAFPNNEQAECGAISAPPTVGNGIDASDACSGPVAQISMTETSNRDPNPLVCGHYSYTITRVFTAQDDCGNTRTVSQIISVFDSQPPVFNSNATFSRSCDALQTLPAPTAVDACDLNAPTISADGPDVILAGSCPENYTLQKHWKAQDVCGNISHFIQNVLVSDTTKPTLAGVPNNLAVGCNGAPQPPIIGTDLIGTDNCDPSPSVFFQENSSQEANPTSCDHYNYFITRTWTVIDNCQNSNVFTQNIQVADNEPPVLQLRPAATLPCGLNQCGLDALFDSPLLLTDDCTAATSTAMPTTTENLENTSGLPDNFAKVDDVVLNILLPNSLPEQPALSPATIELNFVGLDGEQATEYFDIFGEDGSLLGQSPHTTTQCGDTAMTLALTVQQLNDWGQDGQLTLVFKSAGDTTMAINKICINSYISATAIYQYANPQIPIDVSYKIDGGAVSAWPQISSDFIAVGPHILTVFATDCSGNQSSATQQITVLDVFSPAITPPNDTLIYASDTCTTRFTLPFPLGLTENCGFSKNYDKTTPNQPLHFYNDPNAGDIPDWVTLNFTGVVPNATNGATLTLKTLADNGDFGEFFQIFDENDVWIGNSNSANANQCINETTTNFTFSAAQINQWAADGAIHFTVKANKDATIWIDFVNPCGPLDANGFDGKSYVAGRLNYEWADLNFSIKTQSGTTVKTGKVIGNQSLTSLAAGYYQVEYSTVDRNGLTGSATYALTVRDTTRPTALCQGSQIFVNPSGVVDYTLLPQTLDAGSHDNCLAPLSFSLNPSTISCASIGQSTTVLLTVTDEWGNQNTCQSIISVNGESPQPTYLAGVCQNDTLHLFANPPAAPGNVVYTFDWTGPNGFHSNEENPSIPNAGAAQEGSYTCSVSGLTGCSATGFAQIDIVELPAQPSLVANQPNFCDGDNVILTTQTAVGSNPQYLWYSGQFPTGTLLGTTITPQFLVPSPQVGDHHFYVMLKANGCTSLPSQDLPLTIHAHPAPAQMTAGITVCEGLPIVLGTQTSGSGISYQWSGPNGFSSTSQFPQAILHALPVVHEGIYSLVIFENGCPSQPSTTNVLVKPRPATPEIGTDVPKCTGQTLQLVSNVTNAESYIWFPPLYPNVSADSTLVNGLTLSNANTSFSGDWRVLIFKGGCPSDTSAVGEVIVKDYPSVAAANNGPICDGDPLNLMATTDQASTSNFHWTGPNGYSNFSQNPTLTQPSQGVYNVTVTNEIGCSTTGQTMVQIVQRPFIATLIHDAPTCENSSQDIHLQALITPADTSYVYLWTGPNGWSSTQKSPVLNGATIVWNGAYTLSIIKNLGQNVCVSNPKTVNVAIAPTPATPSITTVAPLCAGSAFTILVNNPGDYPANASYIWHTPLGEVTTNGPSLTIPNANLSHNGDYWLEVAVNSCKSGISSITQVVVHSVPYPPTVTTNSPVCAGDAITMTAPLFSGTIYQWFGPNMFSSSVYNPTILNAQAANSGQYFIKISQNGCESQFSEPINVVVKPRPIAPSLAGVPQICLDQAGATVTLAVNQPSQTANATYDWFQFLGPTTQQFLATSGPVAGLVYGNLNSFSQGQVGFTATATLNGCTSQPSAPFFVEMFEIPTNLADAGVNKTDCFGQTVQLAAQIPTIGSGFWTQNGGASLPISNPTLATTTVGPNVPIGNYSFVWTLSNGACLNYSSDTVAIAVNNFEMANAGKAIDTCFATIVQLSAIAAQNGNGFWTQPSVQNLLGVKIESPSDPKTLISGLTPGSLYTFTWNLPDQGCGPTSSDVLVRILNSEAFAGNDRVECSTNGCVVAVAAPVSQFETGVWTSPNDPEITFANPTASTTDACGLKPGANLFVWTLNNGTCGFHSVDSLILTYEPVPTVVNDTIAVPFGSTQRFDVVLNDGLPNSWNLKQNDGVSHGRLTEIGNGVFDYQPEIGFKNTDRFTYTICNLACPNACSMAEVILQVGDAPDCDPPTIITPNGDAVNDIFYVPCLSADGGANNEVSIFNEWGDEVFHAKPYKNDWAGLYNGQELPAGTYFFVIETSGSVRKGFLVIQR